jgi:hypothetical protein
VTRVFGVGWAKTGTTTLAACFRALGYDHQSQRLDLVEDIRRGDLSRIFDLAGEHETLEDWPWIVLFRELDARFPGSRFILTTRAPEHWIGSYRRELAKGGVASPAMNAVRRTLYGLPFPDVSDAELVERVARHDREVCAHFASRPDDLLVVDWESGDGWTKLCAFLGRAVPDQPFPHENRSN